jgi:hypothetical protein
MNKRKNRLSTTSLFFCYCKLTILVLHYTSKYGMMYLETRKGVIYMGWAWNKMPEPSREGTGNENKKVSDSKELDKLSKKQDENSPEGKEKDV